MPYKFKRPCSIPGCPKLTDKRFCSIHQKEYERTRGSASERGYNNRWQKARKRYLKGHPLCVECLKQSKYIPADVVDHITPHRGDQTLFWDESNWQSLCKRCHDKKTGSKDRFKEYKY